MNSGKSPKPDAGEGLVAKKTGKSTRKRPPRHGTDFSNPRNDKALNNQGFGGTNMAEAMGFELMDLLQSTVFKTDI
ncbi:hypothetical protein ACQR3P_01610 [Rhodococcus sp. IEGM1300]